MATEVARLRAILDADTSDFDRAMGRSQSRTSKFATVAKAGVLAVGAAVAYGLGKVAKIGWDEFNQGQQIAAQTNAVLKSTGGVAGVTAKHVEELSAAMLRKTGIDDEATGAAQNLLLTFTQIGAAGGIFDRTTQSVADMATAMNNGAIPSQEQMSNTAITVGKALNNPIAGLGRLTRVGVEFTEQQKKQITALAEAGKVEKAQVLILKELEKEFGGSAKAAGETFAGQITKLRERFNNWAGEMVGRAIPALQAFAKDAIPFVNRAIETIRQTGDQFMAWVRGTLVPAIQSVIETGRELWARFGDDIKRNLRAAANIIRNLLNVVIGIVEFFAAVLRGDWSAAWAAIKKIAVNAVQGLLTYLKAVVTNLLRAGLALGKAVVTGVGNGLKALASKVGEFIGKGVDKVREFVGRAGAAALDLGRSVVTGIVNGLAGLASALYEKLKSEITGAFGRVKRFFGIGSPSKVAAKEIGAPIGQGIVDGILAQTGAVRAALQGAVAGTSARAPSLAMAAPAAARGMAAAGGNVIVNVPRDAVILDGAKLLRLIDQARERQIRQGGR